MLCNLEPPILRGIHDAFCAKWQQGFQSFLYPINTPDVRKYATMLGLIVWVGFKKQLKNCQNETDSILLMRKLRTQSLWLLCISPSHSKGRSYGENKDKGHWFWTCQERGLEEDERTEEVIKDNVGWRQLIPCGHPWKQQLKLEEGGVLRLLFVFCDYHAVWAGSWQLAGKEMEFYITSYINISVISVFIFRKLTTACEFSFYPAEVIDDSWRLILTRSDSHLFVHSRPLYKLGKATFKHHWSGTRVNISIFLYYFTAEWRETRS